MQVHDHNNAGFHRDAKQRDIADSDADAEVMAKQPLKNQFAGHRIERGKDQDHSLSE
jgi:hypothetical protein